MKRTSVMSSAGLVLMVSASLAATDVAAAKSDPGARAGFNSQFNGTKSGWSNAVGTWTLRSGNLYNSGIPGKMTSVKHANRYTNLHYTVKMRRTGNSHPSARNSVWIRGDASRPWPTGVWRSGYQFSYANAGYFLVVRFKASGGYEVLQDWTPNSAIKGTGYNVLEVWAYEDGFLDFHINNVHMWSGFDRNGPTYGQVGLSTSTDPRKVSETYVDYATLTPLAGRETECHVDASGQHHGAALWAWPGADPARAGSRGP